MDWDIFCKVIDNHGDLGVCWRLTRQLAARGHAVRLWVDDARALPWMAPGALQGAFTKATLNKSPRIGAPGFGMGCEAQSAAIPGGIASICNDADRPKPGCDSREGLVQRCPITVLPWTQPIAPDVLARLPLSDQTGVWIEAFGCELPPEFIAHHAQRVAAHGAPPPVWINLEYLSAERHVERLHGLPSPVQHGPAAGWTKWFFYPGFTPATGGLLREDDLPARQNTFDRTAWRRAQGIADGALAASLFCYEPPALPELLARWQQGPPPVHLLVTAGRATDAVQAAGIPAERLRARAHTYPDALTLTALPYLPQPAYDELLWGCDLNFVRGEDSLVRALLAGQPLVWQIYPQHDDAHHAKLNAFLHWLDAPPSLRDFHHAWNGITRSPLPAPDLPAWRACVRAARARLLAQPDLASQLTRFITDKAVKC